VEKTCFFFFIMLIFSFSKVLNVGKAPFLDSPKHREIAFKNGDGLNDFCQEGIRKTSPSYHQPTETLPQLGSQKLKAISLCSA